MNPNDPSAREFPFGSGPRVATNEETLRTERLQIERKLFVFALKENPRGRFLRITEDVGGRRDTIIVPATGLGLPSRPNNHEQAPDGFWSSGGSGLQPCRMLARPGWLQSGRVPPETFQVVTLAHIGPHDVNDDVEEIEHDPAVLDGSIHGPGGDLVIFPEAIGDFLRDGAQMRFAGAGRDHEIIGDAGNGFYIQHQNLLRLPVVRELTAFQGQLL
jgi:hypothetical protein